MPANLTPQYLAAEQRFKEVATNRIAVLNQLRRAEI
jgi:hypothetical protein